MAGSLPPRIPAAGHCALPLAGPRRGSEAGSWRTDVCATPLGDRQNGADQSVGVACGSVDHRRYSLHISQLSVP